MPVAPAGNVMVYIVFGARPPAAVDWIWMTVFTAVVICVMLTVVYGTAPSSITMLEMLAGSSGAFVAAVMVSVRETLMSPSLMTWTDSVSGWTLKLNAVRSGGEQPL